MTKKDFKDGWWEMPAGLPMWICPECKTGTWTSRWGEREVYCEDCGSHDGRECPACGEVFDHVWGDRLIYDATLIRK